MVQMPSLCKAQLQRDFIRNTQHSVAKHNGPSDLFLSLAFSLALFLFLLFSWTAVLPAPMGNEPHICRGLAHMHRHTAIAQELAQCVHTHKEETHSHIQTQEEVRETHPDTKHSSHTLPLNCIIFNLESVLT